MKKQTDVLIAGSGCAGLYCALNLSEDTKITIITKATIEESDSFLAQGGMCMLKNDEDYDSYFEDTMRAGHYENDKTSVDIMIRSSQDVVKDLVSIGVDFEREADGSFCFTREGAHSDKRILYHKDITGKEITSKLLARAKQKKNIEIIEHAMLLDILEKDGRCIGGIIRENGQLKVVESKILVLATGGVGGLYRHSTNFRQLTGDALAIALKHNVSTKDINYIQIHPTTLWSENDRKRSFLISESVRGEGAKLYDKNGNRFVDELLPRDLLTNEIKKQMEKDQTEYVWEDLRPIPIEELQAHFPNIVKRCMEEGYDVTKECIPVVPAQHYYMGGIRVDHESKTSMDCLYAVGETACNGVHGKNRLASNSLLESLVFAKRAAKQINELAIDNWKLQDAGEVSLEEYRDEKALELKYKQMVRDAMREADMRA
ncbi:MAG: L-aspartate oxidase [Lachnospiraceae bacterium]|nr:L-aspartate oxidase [Lachnospiraceae bacterium]